MGPKGEREGWRGKGWGRGNEGEREGRRGQERGGGSEREREGWTGDERRLEGEWRGLGRGVGWETFVSWTAHACTHAPPSPS